MSKEIKRLVDLPLEWDDVAPGPGALRARVVLAVSLLRTARRRQGPSRYARDPAPCRPGVLRIAERLTAGRRIAHQAVGPADGLEPAGAGHAGQYDLVARGSVHGGARSRWVSQ